MAGQLKKSKKSKLIYAKSVWYILIIFIFFSGIFFMLGYTLADSISSQDKAKPEITIHSHSKYEVGPNEPKPTITSFDVQKDSKSGWNITINTKNFEFAPSLVNQEHFPGKGHAHLYINGQKITRIYSNNYYLSGYEDAVYEIEVTLNTNSHSNYYVDGKQVKAAAQLSGSHSHSAGTPEEHTH